MTLCVSLCAWTRSLSERQAFTLTIVRSFACAYVDESVSRICFLSLCSSLFVIPDNYILDLIVFRNGKKYSITFSFIYGREKCIKCWQILLKITT